MPYLVPRFASRQAGAVLLILMLVLTVGAASLLLSGLKPRDPEQIRREQSAAALAQARQALLAWSLTRDGEASGGGRALSPLELPCPANPNETNISTIGTSITSCNNAGSAAARIGWLPWKTLGIPKLTDAYGEPLWYAVDLSFVVRSSANEARKVNADSLSSLQVFHRNLDQSSNGQNPAAVIFAPGPPLAGQQRASPLSADQFLDRAASYANDVADGPFISDALSEGFNDQLTIITGFELIDGAQARWGAAIALQLQTYVSAYQLGTPLVAAASPLIKPPSGRAVLLAARYIPQKATAATQSCAPRWQASAVYQAGDVVSETPGNSSNWKNYTAVTGSQGISPQGSPGVWGTGSTCNLVSPTATPSASPVPTASPAPVSLPEQYPYPANIISDSTCRDNVLYPANTGCRSQANLCAGILPRAVDDWIGKERFSPPAANLLDTWFTQNLWHRAVFYAVKQGTVCNANIVIDGVSEPNIDAIYILPGAPRSARANNRIAAAAASSDLSLYLDDVENQSQWLNPSLRSWVTPRCSSNDLMYTCQQGVCSLRSSTC